MKLKQELHHLYNLHPLFYISHMRQYDFNPSQVIELYLVQVRDNLTYDAVPIDISDKRLRRLHCKVILLIKVHWSINDKENWT